MIIQLYRKELIRELEHLGIPRKLIAPLEMTLINTSTQVRFQGTTTEPFAINKGVKQGDSLSPTIFNLILEGIMRRTKLDKKNIMTNHIQTIAYADDIAIIGNKKEDIARAVDQLDKEAKKFGMEINEVKTKYLKKIKKEHEHAQNYLKTQEYIFERVNSFNYLGVTMGQTAENKVKERLLKGSQAYGRNKTLLKSKALSKTTKIKIYKTLIRPIITYAMETIAINKKEEENLKIIERKIMRIILGPNITREGEIRLRKNKEIEEELGGENIARFIKTQRLRWAGHINYEKRTKGDDKEDYAVDTLRTQETRKTKEKMERCPRRRHKSNGNRRLEVEMQG